MSSNGNKNFRKIVPFGTVNLAQVAQVATVAQHVVGASNPPVVHDADATFVTTAAPTRAILLSGSMVTIATARTLTIAAADSHAGAAAVITGLFTGGALVNNSMSFNLHVVAGTTIALAGYFVSSGTFVQLHGVPAAGLVNDELGGNYYRVTARVLSLETNAHKVSISFDKTTF
jgi:hypothetical protein